jgi:large subunit ribosomal protein L19
MSHTTWRRLDSFDHLCCASCKMIPMPIRGLRPMVVSLFPPMTRRTSLGSLRSRCVEFGSSPRRQQSSWSPSSIFGTNTLACFGVGTKPEPLLGSHRSIPLLQLASKFGTRSSSFSTVPDSLDDDSDDGAVHRDDMPFLHHGTRLRNRTNPKFKSPRKRATGLMNLLRAEMIASSRSTKPDVFDTNFRVGDAIEATVVSPNGGSVATGKTEKVRGVVLGIFRKGLDHSVLIRDVVYGEPVERRLLLHSPLLKSIRILESNFVHKGKRKVKRAKLYYLRDRNPLGT